MSGGSGSLAPPPERALARTLPLDALVRDYPETLAPLRSLGVDPASRGIAPIGELASDAAEAALDLVEAVTAWRAGGPGEEPSL